MAASPSTEPPATDPLHAPAAIGGGSFGGIGSPRHLIGQGLDERATGEVLDRCLRLGVTILDTAHSYAAGASQQMIGAWLAGDPARRARVAIVDKVGVVEGADGLGVDLSPANIASCAAEGRARMGVEAVDVVMTHAPDGAVPIGETLAALAGLVEQGHAGAWGLSNVDAADLAAWLDEADRLSVSPPRFVEDEYNLVARDVEDGVLALCRERRIEFLAYGPLAGGVLSGKYRRGEEVPARSRLSLRPEAAAALTDEVFDRLDVLHAEAAARGTSPAGLALAWVLTQPGVRPIVGASRPAQLDALEEALSIRLDEDAAARLGAAMAPAGDRRRGER
ncbi:MAG TPA: aldo/keto reductase [Acidimicrobiales bacterium]|nr:aldo/keto reductase [Acidimicrobiales bacterium]